jgi:prepilin-type N-terminal cleavage/methylation domain-containing protein
MTSRGGFTLIEVLVALVVAVAAMALLSQGFSTGARASTSSQYTTRATILAQRVITDLETGYLPATSNQNGSFDDEPDFSYETLSETYDSPSGSLTLTNLTKVTVTIHWMQHNVDQSFALVRLLRTSSTAGSTTTPSTTPSTTTPK